MKPSRTWLTWLLSSLLLAMATSVVNARAADVSPGSVRLTPADPGHATFAASPIPPGTLMKSEPLSDRSLPANAQAWLIQYTTTAPDGTPANAVAIVLAPLDLPAGPLPVIAWAHGAVGLMQHCLPSTQPDPWLNMPAQQQAIAQGWIVVATDYGVNADGVHPFLIGAGEARSTLDAVRALRQMPELSVDKRTVVWGHSQGGHAALWTAMIAGAYAPDVAVKGIVAISPVTSLVSLLGRQADSSLAPLLAAWVATAYSEFYPDVDYDVIVNESARAIGRELAARCPTEPLDAVAIALLLGEIGDQVLLTLPVPDAFGARLRENEPNGEMTVPVVIAQGLKDVVVLPQGTAEFVAARCLDDAAITFWQLPDDDHLSLVQPGSPLVAPLIAWTEERFAGEATGNACSSQVIAATNK